MIGLLGGECSGKSTLASALGATLPACIVPEALRDFVDRHGRPPHPHEQRDIRDEQRAREASVAQTCRHPWVVVDPAPLMTAVYSIVYFGDRRLLDDDLRHAHDYDLLVWCAPDIPWQPDGDQRDGPDHRRAADEVIRELVEGSGLLRAVDVLHVTGSVEDRVASVLARLAWQPGAHGPST